jgi:DNA-binding transcriptional MerR regulator
MEKMLKTASKNLGIPPKELKELLSKGDVNTIMSKMNSKDAQNLKKAMANPNVEEMLKNSPEMQDYMKNSSNSSNPKK